MAQLAKILLLFLCQYLLVISGNDDRTTPDASPNSEDISQFVLDFLNADTESDFIYNSPVITGKQRQNNSEQYLVTAVVSTQCRENISGSCNPADLVCEVLLNDEPGSRSISHKLCAPREQNVVLPTTEQGFTEVVGEKMALSAPDVLTLDTEDSTQFLVVDVMSMKEWVDENGTSIYLTVKATKNDGSDTLQFVVCEFMNGTNAERTVCFPLETDHPDIVPDGENVTEVAKAVELLNKLSPSRYINALRSLLNIEKIVTPGSNGILTTLKMILAPTLCLKRLEDDAVERLCTPSDNGSSIVCRMTLWDRPWSTRGVLHSVPDCHLEERQVSSTQESLVQAAATINRQPVVEEPFVARHTFCTGCPTALNVDTPRVRELVEQSLNLLDEGTGSIYKHALVRIVKAEKQVVNGVKYNIYLDVGESSCLKGSPEDRSICPLNNMGGDAVRTCHFEFTEQAWLRSGRQLSDSNCTTVYGRKNDNNELDNEIEPHSLENAVRQSIYDYLDAAMEEPSFSLKEISPSFRDDSEEAFFSSRRLSLIDDEIIPDVEVSSASPVEVFTSTEPDPVTTSTDSDADAMRTRRETEMEFTGGKLKSIDDSEKEYIEQLAYQAVETLDEIDADDAKRVVAEVIDAQKQLVDGIMYYLKLKVVSTGCKEDTTRKKNDCLREQVAPTKICTVQLHKAFANTSPKNVQVVKAECFIEPSSVSERQKREVEDPGVESEESPPLVGGYRAVDKNSDAVRKATDLGLSHLTEQSSGNSALILIKVLSASQQVVAGTNTKVKMEVGISNCTKTEANENEVCVMNESENTKQCTVVVWNQSWTNRTEVTEASCEESGLHRQKRSEERPRLIGGYRIVDNDSVAVKKAADLAMAHLAEQSSEDSHPVLVNVVSAEQQVVAGINTKLTLEVGVSNCTKSEARENEVCVLKEGKKTKQCTAVVFNQAWSNTNQVTEASCEESDQYHRKRSPGADPSVQRSKRGIPGGYSPIANLDDQKQNAEFAIAHLEQLSNDDSKLCLKELKEGSRQVVAGFNTKLVMVLGPCNCSKSATQQNTVCVLKEAEATKECTAVIYEQPWTNTKQVTKVTCNNNSHDRRRREAGVLTGAPEDANASDPTIQEIADFAMEQINKQSNNLYLQQHDKILRAKSQLVAGTLYSLDLRVDDTNCRKGHKMTKKCELKNSSDKQICSVKVLDVPWTKERTLKSFKCEADTRNMSKRNSKIGKGSHDIHFSLFKDFMNVHKKQYKTRSEMKHRFHIFRANLKKIQRLQETEQGTAKYGPTRFADLTPKEFKALHTGLNPSLRHENSIPMPHAEIPDISLPTEFDWRHYNAVTEVKDQGGCGSCWAFSVTGNIEGLNAIRSGKLVSFSEQELVDCDILDNGCSGGLPDNAYRALETIGGLETEKDYPYEGENEKCHFNRSEVIVQVRGGLNISSNETKMAQWLVKNGPIAIGINANAMQFYMGGVSHPWKFLCEGDQLDHGVLIVGYGVHTYPLFNRTLPFWTIKNSWGSSWGEQGYYRVYRGDGTCGVNQMASTAILV